MLIFAAATDAANVGDVGEVCVGLDGNSLMLFFGPTPISPGSEWRLISPANVVGCVGGDCQAQSSVNAGDSIRVVQAEMVEM